ncbi:MAG TPA: hypoxanthine phosphoribosyltransferase [Thermoanaerobaculia bacterium]|nr:hypoxanthine phosphoribosyltransferase [Thermoanaerobaculia bacterium]
MAQTTLITREQIDQRVAQMAREISADFEGADLIALCVLKGAMFFCADLVREMSMDVALDFIQISSYGNNKYSSGVVTILKEPQLDMRGRSVLIVEDIIDSGLSIREVNNYIESRGAAAVKTAAFLDKPKARKVPFTPNYVGFSIDPQFVIGYGLDFAEKYRNLPFVGTLAPHVYGG